VRELDRLSLDEDESIDLLVRAVIELQEIAQADMNTSIRSQRERTD
jgi:hypothetical protein